MNLQSEIQIACTFPIEADWGDTPGSLLGDGWCQELGYYRVVVKPSGDVVILHVPQMVLDWN